MTRIDDAQGNALAGASRAAADRLDATLLKLAAFRLDPLADAEAIIADHPGFAMAHILRATLFLMAAEAAAEPELQASIAAARAVPDRPNEREAMHLSALEAWARRDFLGAATAYAELSARYPTDLLALQAGQQVDFFTGRTSDLRDRIARALPFWSSDMPGRSFVDGMLSFGLEENNQFAEAEAAGLRALDGFAGDAWAVHAVTHVAEMRGRSADGIAFLRGREQDWAPGNMLAFHNWWHLALFHLEDGDIGTALQIHDAQLARSPGAPAIELLDTAALLWRLHLRGVDVRDRFAPVADAWEACFAAEPGVSYQVFNDVHAALAHVGAGRPERAAAVEASVARLAASDSPHAPVAASVGLPIVSAINAFAGGDAARAAATLLAVRPLAHRMGGSNAQRDVLSLTLIAAAEAAGDAPLLAAMAAERRSWKPESPFAAAALGRARAMAA